MLPPVRRCCGAALVLCATASSPAVAQVSSSHTVSRLEPDLRFDQVIDGLPQTNVTAIVQDQDGFIWFGTQDGLARYDTNQFRVYRPDRDNPASISARYINALAVDRDGSMWVATNRGLNRYDPRTDSFTRFFHDPKDSSSIASPGVRALHVDRENRLWLAPSDGGLQFYDARARSFRTVPLEYGIQDIEEDGKGNLWLATAGAGLVRFNPRKPTYTAQFKHGERASTLSNDTVNTVLVDSKGIVWAGTERGLNRLDPSTGTFTRYLPSADVPTSISGARVTVLLEDRGGRLWVGTYTGFNLMDREAGTFTRFVSHEGDLHSISYNHQTSIFQDRSGVIWVGTWAGGVNKFDELRLSFHNQRTADAALAFFQDRGGVVWLGTFQRGLYRFDRRRGTVTHYKDLIAPPPPPPRKAKKRAAKRAKPAKTAAGAAIALDSTWLGAVHGDASGTMWLGTQTLGLIAFDPKSDAFTQYRADPDNPDALSTDTIWDIEPGEDGNLWLAGWSETPGRGGLIKFNRKRNIFVTYAQAPHDPTGPPTALYIVKRDRRDRNVLWLGAAEQGLVRFDTATETATLYSHDEASAQTIGGKDVISLYQEPSGQLWVGTEAGLSRFDPSSGRAERFPPESGLPQNEVYCILPDQRGRLWLSTNGRGLLVFDPRAKKVVLAFDGRDGLQGNEFAQGGCLQGADGELFFGGLKGFNAFRPAEIKLDQKPPPLALTSFKLFNDEKRFDRTIWKLPDIDLSYRDSVFSIEFAALSYASPEKNRYAYKLEGLHDEWIQSTRPFVTYTNLDGGDYVFRARAANRHGVWSDKEVALKLHVDPPPWKTWWALALYVLLGIAAVLTYALYQRQRIGALRQRNRLRAVEREIELTGAVQAGFLPKHNAVESDRFELFGFYRPAEVCSGDWWWYEQVASGRYSLLVGDVTGHGPGPAMVTAAAATAFRVQANLTVKERLEILNQEVLYVGGGQYQMTLSALELDVQSGDFVYYSAGGLPAISVAPRGEARVLPCRGTPLGTVDFSAGELGGRLAAGEKMIVYTDGIPEIQMRNGRMLGMRRFVRIVEETRGARLADAAQHIVSSADAARENRAQGDDWTIALVQWHGASGARM